MPAFVLRIGLQEYVVPHNRGVAAVLALLADAVPVSASLGTTPEIELLWTDDDEHFMQQAATTVSVQKIPRGTKWKRKTKLGEVVEVRPVQKMSKSLERTVRAALKLQARASESKGLPAPAAPLQLEFGR